MDNKITENWIKEINSEISNMTFEIENFVDMVAHNTSDLSTEEKIKDNGDYIKDIFDSILDEYSKKLESKFKKGHVVFDKYVDDVMKEWKSRL